MTTEEEARGLLARAAATIEVDETVPVALAQPEPGHRRWPVLAAAAAVMVAAGGGYAVAQQLTGQDGPAPAPAVRTPTVTNETGPPARDDALPSLLGYTEDEAIELLQELSHPVEVRVVPDGCDVPGIVTGTSPPPGSPVDPRTPVTIRVVGEKVVIDCVGEVPMGIVWDVVRAARGLGDAGSLDTADFDPDVRSAVEAMVDGRSGGESQELVATWAFDNHPCWPDGVEGIRFFMQGGRDDLVCPPVSAVVDFEGERITGVRVETAGPDATPPLTEARENAPLAFIVWATGDTDTPPGFADRVRLVGGGFHPAWVDDPADRSRYSGCSGLGFPDCGIDPVAAIFHADGPIEATPGNLPVRADLPPRLVAAEDDLVSLGYREAGELRPLVDLWIDEDGEIYAVTQTGMPPR